MKRPDSTHPPRECVRCLYRSSHPFGLQINSEGLCTGCITHQEKFELDWNARFLELKELTAQQKRTNRNKHYDCVVPIRGTPEYFYVMEVVKNRLGLNPLAVSYNSQFNSEVGIQNLDRIRDTFDVDVLVYSSSAPIYKKLVRESLVRFSNMRWPYLAGESVFPVQVAVERNIPLIVWPYHQATEQVGMHSYKETPEMSRRNRAQFDLLGIEPEELDSSETLVRKNDVWDLLYPSDRDLVRTRLRGIYLSNYLPWDTRSYSEKMIREFGAISARNPRTFDTYDRIDDMTYMSIHDVLKFYLHGYSRVTDNLSREIRFGRITREDAVTLEKYYQSEYPRQNIQMFLDWLGMGYDSFVWYAEKMPFFRHPPQKPNLEKRHHVFIEGFSHDSRLVMDGGEFTIYGKGINNTTKPH